MIVFSNPLPGREADYASWYINRHLIDMMTVPGVRNGQFFIAAQSSGRARWRHLGLYEIDPGANAGILEFIQAHRYAPAWERTDAIDNSTVNLLFGEPLGPSVCGNVGTPSEDRVSSGRMISLGSPLPGWETEFDRWCEEVHVPYMLALAGMVDAQRFALTGRNGPSPWKCAAIFEANRDPDEICRDWLQRGARDGARSAPGGQKSQCLFFTALTERLTATNCLGGDPIDGVRSPNGLATGG